MNAELIAVGVGALFIGGLGFLAFREPMLKYYIRRKKQKEIMQIKQAFRDIDFANIPKEQRIYVYSKFYDADILTEAEILYFKTKSFDDLVDYLLSIDMQTNYFIKKWKLFKILNKNHAIVQELKAHAWSNKIIRNAFEEYERRLNNHGKTTIKPIIPRTKREIEQINEETGESRATSN